jgi:uncharacterized protein
MTAPVIEHQPDQNRFVCDTGNGQALITYQLHGTTIDFNHTYVPATARGRGIAALLVDAAAAWARAQGYTLTASCWYARDYLQLAR